MPTPDFRKCIYDNCQELIDVAGDLSLIVVLTPVPSTTPPKVPSITFVSAPKASALQESFIYTLSLNPLHHWCLMMSLSPQPQETLLWIISHSKSHSDHHRDLAPDFDETIKTLNLSDSSFSSPTGSVEVMDILPPPIEGHRCLLCVYRCCSISSQRNHFHQFHPHEKFHKRHFTPCLMQSWYAHDLAARPPGERYQWVVKSPAKPKEPLTVFLERQRVHLGKMVEPGDSPEISNREVHVLLDRNRFHTIYPTLNECTRIHELCQTPTSATFSDFENLLSWVQSYMKVIELATIHLPGAMLTSVTRTRSDFSHDLTPPFAWPSARSTRDRRQRVLLRLLAFVIRSSSQDLSSLGIHLSPVDRAVVTNFTLEMVGVAPVVSQTASQFPSDIGALDQLLILLITTEPAVSHGQAPHILERFIVGVSLGSGVLWHPPSTLAPLLRDIQWLFHAIVLVHMFANMKNDLSAAFTFFHEMKSVCLNETSALPFSFLRTNLTIASGLANHAQSDGNLTWYPRGDMLSFDGIPIKLEDVKTMAQDLVKETEGALEKLIVHSFDDFEALVAKHMDLSRPESGLIDEVSNLQPGYSLFTETRNGYDQYENTLLQYLVEKEKFATHVSSNPPQWLWDHAKILRFLALDAEFLVLLQQAIYGTVGAPPRQTEQQMLFFSNTREAQRNVVAQHGIIQCIFRYNKTQRQTYSSRVIVRTPAHAISKCILRYGALVRPATTFLTRLLYGSASIRYEHCVFVSYGHMMPEGQLSKNWSARTFQYLKTALGVRAWRHILKFLLRALTSTATNPQGHDIDALDPPPEDMGIDVGFGHSASTGKHYGRESDLVSGLSGTSERTLEEICRVFHTFLGLGVEIPQVPLLPSDPNASSVTTVLSNSSAQLQLGRVLSEGMHNALSTLLPAFCNSIASFMSHQAGPQSTITPSTYIPPHASLLLHLWRLHGNNAKFRSVEQSDLVAACLVPHTHVFGILPTGGGKSDAYMIPAMVNPDVITIVVLSLRALEADVQLRLQSTHISSRRWDSSNSTHATLQLIPLELAITDDFIQWCMPRARNKILQRIVIDEAHLIYSWRTFRPFKHLCDLVELGVQIVLLSATATPRMVNSVLQILGLELKTMRIIRAPRTSRPELTYSHIRLEDSNAVENYVIRLVHEFQVDMPPNDRILVVCNTKLQVGRFVDRIQPKPFHYMGGEPDRDTEFLRWHNGMPEDLIAPSQVLVGTMAVSHGIDHPNITHVILAELPSTIDIYEQSFGRGGRRQQRTKCFAVFSCAPRPCEDHGNAEIISLAENMPPTACLRRLRDLYYDGVHYSCTQLGGQLCEFCEIEMSWITSSPYSSSPCSSSSCSSSPAARPPAARTSVDRGSIDRGSLIVALWIVALWIVALWIVALWIVALWIVALWIVVPLIAPLWLVPLQLVVLRLVVLRLVVLRLVPLQLVPLWIVAPLIAPLWIVVPLIAPLWLAPLLTAPPLIVPQQLVSLLIARLLFLVLDPPPPIELDHLQDQI
ncbi:hypothetical protein BS47DRAFT_1362064 [Hydnum rufescens UP504]|uniref:DNA 3'-5' helicase n=1 Tax=Hydnum rufescens UP504 TaxID=1448309 RepID=A0A9P6DU77_9AGAM|nr:hypothetical protein BS47DRAFT_1362064 [Hydnum rufescens UP504]